MILCSKKLHHIYGLIKKPKKQLNFMFLLLRIPPLRMPQCFMYPFSERYAWIQDKYGLSWQLMSFGNRPIKQRIIPTVMFVGKVTGKAEEAVNFYVSIFHNSAVGELM